MKVPLCSSRSVACSRCAPGQSSVQLDRRVANEPLAGPLAAGEVGGAARYCAAPVQYPVESFTESERERLRPHFTNLDRPVFALVNLPETVKAALFARYSRYPGTLRRLFLDEFADDLGSDPGALTAHGEGKGAAGLNDLIFLVYGD